MTTGLRFFIGFEHEKSDGITSRVSEACADMGSVLLSCNTQFNHLACTDFHVFEVASYLAPEVFSVEIAKTANLTGASGWTYLLKEPMPVIWESE